MRLASIFYGRVRVVYSWGRYGWTRGDGKTWHGGIDLVGLDDKTIRMPYYKGKKITGKVVRARIVLDRSNKTWEWGYYVCVQLDANQTPDAVNFLYFCHCSSLLVQVGQKVSSGDALAVMGRTGNAALGDCPYDHCHLEVRATATGRGLDPTAYAGCDNAVGVYGTAEAAAPMAGAHQADRATPAQMVTRGVTRISTLVSLETALPISAARMAMTSTARGPPAPPRPLAAEPTAMREKRTSGGA